MATPDTVAELETSLSDVTLEDLHSRHRRERKELQAKIQALKKNAPKNEKKKRKEVMEGIQRMESELDKRQAAEVAAAEQAQKEHQSETQTQEVNKHEENGDEDDKEGAVQRVSKAQKRRDKKAREARQREEEIRAAAEDAQFAPKEIEARNLEAKLKERQLALHLIPSDGDCLYNAIRHQLLQNGLVAYSVQELRNETANYIRAHKDSLICYMTNAENGDLLNDAEFEEYCDTLRNTPAWGGQIELKALSSVLKVPIEVLQAEGPPTVQGANEFPGPNLTITYHRLMFSLGEHYNSTVPLSDTHTNSKEEDNV